MIYEHDTVDVSDLGIVPIKTVLPTEKALYEFILTENIKDKDLDFTALSRIFHLYRADR